MNEKSIVVNLLELTDGKNNPYGNALGKQVFRKFADFIDAHPLTDIFGVSLNGIEATDASFPRESIISVAKQYRGKKGIFLKDLIDRDIIDNWRYAATAKEQPLVIWSGSTFEVIGPELSASTTSLVNYVLEKSSVTTPQVAHDLNISIQNASTRLKNLVQQSYVMRSNVASETGGIEFIYHAIK